jgi:hypothetical protein
MRCRTPFGPEFHLRRAKFGGGFRMQFQVSAPRAEIFSEQIGRGPRCRAFARQIKRARAKYLSRREFFSCRHAFIRIICVLDARSRIFFIPRSACGLPDSRRFAPELRRASDHGCREFARWEFFCASAFDARFRLADGARHTVVSVQNPRLAVENFAGALLSEKFR